jgi:Fe-S oxidoreductase
VSELDKTEMDEENTEIGDALPEPLELPQLTPGAMAELHTFEAAPAHQEALGFPGELPDNWQDVAIAKIGDLRNRYRSFRVYLDSCVKCGACTDKCHYFLGTGDPKNMPFARQDLMRSVYRRYFTLPGKIAPWLVGARDLTEDVLEEWYNYYHQCSQCRRCSVYCPYGIDTAEISMAAREIMDAVGKGQKYCNEIIGKVHTIGNNLGMPGKAIAATMEDFEEELKEDTGLDIKIPVDKKGADILLVTPSADFFAEPHIDGLFGYAKVFHELGVDWTLSTTASEAGNFGMFIGSYENMRRVSLRVREAALELGVKRIIFGECGHAWRVAYSFLNTLAGPWDFLDPNYPVPQHICEFTYDAIKEGKLKFDKSQNDHMTLTFHDSCNVARATRMGDKPGGQFEIPRAVIKAVCNNYVDMDEDTIREVTVCCGGGGGILTDDLMDIRVKGAQPRMRALRKVTEEHGVTNMAAICAICKSQFSKILPKYDFDMETIQSVHQLVSNALIMSDTGKTEEPTPDAPVEAANAPVSGTEAG